MLCQVDAFFFACHDRNEHQTQGLLSAGSTAKVPRSGVDQALTGSAWAGGLWDVLL